MSLRQILSSEGLGKPRARFLAEIIKDVVAMKISAYDRSSLIRLASSLPKGSAERRAVLVGLRPGKLYAKEAARLIFVAKEQNGQIPFPSEYQEPLCRGEKTMTIRVGDETEIYQVGSTYEATSYEGEPWGVSVEIQRITPLPVDELIDWGIPEADVERVRAEGDGEHVEMIQFNVLG